MPADRASALPAYPPESRRLKLTGLVLAVCGGAALSMVTDRLAGHWLLGVAYLAPHIFLAMLAGNLVAFGLMLLAAGCGSVRTLRDPRRRRAVALQVLMVNALVLVFLAGGVMNDATTTSVLERNGLDGALVLMAYGVCFVVWRLWRRSRQHEAKNADEAMALDSRRPVLYMRSFRDDGMALAAEHGPVLKRRLVRALSLPTPEEHMARILARIGPLIAIGKPGEPLPELGAARLYVPHDEWQQRVTALMQHAALVVVRVGSSPGVLWEIEQALGYLPRQRLVLAILGVSPVAPELLARLAPVLGPSLNAAMSQPAGRTWRGILWGRHERHIGGMVCFDEAGQALAVPVRQRIEPGMRTEMFKQLLRPVSTPLEAAWRTVFVHAGLVGAEARSSRSRLLAVWLALLFGAFGAHWFYLGHTRRGWIYILILPLAMILSWVDAWRFVWIDRADFDARMVGVHAAPPAAATDAGPVGP